MRSQVKPIRSIAPGAKFSTSTSASRISFSIIALPSGVLVFSVSDFLLLLSVMKYSASKSGTSRSWRRVTSPTPGRATFSTSAPNHANNWVHAGPACTPVKSTTLIPSSMPWPTTPLFSYFLVRAYIQTGVNNGRRSKIVRSVFSGEQSCQVATLDLTHRIPGYRRNQVDLLGHFEIAQVRPTEHLEFW